jgi:hypothetical protein
MYDANSPEAAQFIKAKMLNRREKMPTQAKPAEKLPTSPRGAGEEVKAARPIFQIILDMKALIVASGEPMEVRMNIYNMEKKSYLYEDYITNWSKDGAPADIKMLGNLKVIFKDVDPIFLKGSFFLVARIYKHAPVTGESSSLFSKKESTVLHRRPFGVGILALSKLSGLKKDEEYCSTSEDLKIFVVKEEENFSNLPEWIHKGSKDAIPAQLAKGVVVGVKLIQAAFSSLPDEIIGKFSISPSLSFSDHSSTSESRNDFYINLIGASYAQDAKRTGKNVEVEIRVIDSSDFQDCENCLSPSCTTEIPDSKYFSTILYHTNDPIWNETVRLNLPNEQFEGSHILFLNHHVSSKADKQSVFSYGFLPLVGKDGAIIQDGYHEIECYQPSKDLANDLEKCSYLRNESNLIKRKDTLRIYTTLCSTTKTQIDSLQSLFKWVVLGVDELPVVLDKFLTTQGMELVKFTREIFDSLLSILQKHQGSEMIDAEISQSCFLAILHVFDQMTGKLTRYKSLIDSYITSGFKNTDTHQSHTALLSVSTVALKYAEYHAKTQDKKRYKVLTLMAKNLRYVTKFAIASCKTSSQDSKSKKKFRDSFKEFLVSCIKVLELTDAELSAVKGFLYRSLPTIFDDLPEVFSQEDMTSIFIDTFRILDGLQASSTTVDLLRLVRGLLNGYLGSNFTCKKAVEPVLMKLLHSGISSINRDVIDEAYLALAIIAQELDNAHSEALQPRNDSLRKSVGTPRVLRTTSIDNFHAGKSTAALSESKMAITINLEGLLVLFPDLVNFVIAAQNDKSGKKRFPKVKETVESVVKVDLMMDSFSSMLAMLYLMDNNEFMLIVHSLKQQGGLSKLSEFVTNLIYALMNELIDDDVFQTYPEVWVLLKILYFQVSLQCIQKLLPILDKDLEDISYKQLLMDFCIAVLKKCSDYQPTKKGNSNSLESPTASRDTLAVQFKEFKRESLKIIRSVWKYFGEKLAYDLSQYFVSSVLFYAVIVGAEENDDIGIEIFMSLLASDYSKTESYTKIERLLFDVLYKMALEQSDSIDRFFTCLFSKIEPEMNKTDKGKEFCTNIKKIRELLGGLTEVPSSDSHEDERVEVAIRLIHYLEQGNSSERTVQYMEYLVDLHEKLGSHVEAANSLLLYARNLSWTETRILDANGQLPLERECDRKERLYNRVIDYLRFGDEWEKMIEMYDELKNYYWTKAYDFSKAAGILREEARVFENILQIERFFSVYFRVAFYGDFPNNLNGKEFVYKGAKLESNIDFTNRIKKRWPNIYLQMSSDTPSPELIERHKCIISVTTLNVSNAGSWENPSADPFKRIKAHKNIKKYLQNNNSQFFTYKKPVSRSKEEKPKNEFKDLWVLQTFLRIEEPFPTTRRRLQVVDRKEIWITPIENAFNVVRDKSDELEDKIEKVESSVEGQVDVGPLSMTLNGIIDAAVNGGTKKYVEAFLSKSFSSENPSLVSGQKDLTLALEDQIRLLRRGLEVFGRRCGDQLLGLHQHLSRMLEEMSSQTNQLLHK